MKLLISDHIQTPAPLREIHYYLRNFGLYNALNVQSTSVEKKPVAAATAPASKYVKRRH